MTDWFGSQGPDSDFASEPLPDVMLRVGGDEPSFRCDCGCNVFRCVADRPGKYRCNACAATYAVVSDG